MGNIQETMHEGQKMLVLSHRELRGAELLENLKVCTRHLRDHPENNILTPGRTERSGISGLLLSQLMYNHPGRTTFSVTLPPG